MYRKSDSFNEITPNLISKDEKGRVVAYKKFESLLELHSVSAYKVSKHTGIATATLSDWKANKSIPKIDKLKILAEYFGVSDDYFTDEKEKPLNNNGKLTYYENMDIQGRLLILPCEMSTSQISIDKLNELKKQLKGTFNRELTESENKILVTCYFQGLADGIKFENTISSLASTE